VWGRGSGGGGIFRAAYAVQTRYNPPLD